MVPPLNANPVVAMCTQRLSLTLLVLVLIVGASACRTEPEPEPEPQPEPEAGEEADVPLSTEEIADLQASLANYLEPATFRAELRGSPFDEETEDALAERSLEGTVSSSDTTSEEGNRSGLQFMMQSPTGPTRIELTVLPDSPAQGDSLSMLRTTTYEQTPGEQNAAISAAMQQGSHQFQSRGGTLTIDAASEEGVRGRFFFEMQQPGMTERDQWFSLVGVFDTGVKDN